MVNQKPFMGLTLDNLKSRMGMMSDEDAVRVAQANQTQPSNMLSGLLGGAQRVGSGLLGAGQAVGKAFAPELPSIAQNIADVARFTAMAEAQGPQLVTAADLSKLRPVSPASIAAQLPQLRAAEQAALQKPELDRMKAMADLARAGGTGKVGTRYKYPSLYVNKNNPDDFIRTLTDTQTQQIVDQANFEPVDTSVYVPSSLGVMGKGIASRADQHREDLSRPVERHQEDQTTY